MECKDFGTYSLDPVIIPISYALRPEQSHPANVKGNRHLHDRYRYFHHCHKVKGIRCALCHNTTTARLTREHNDANMLEIGAAIVGEIVAMDIVDTFFMRISFSRRAPSEKDRQDRG